jgi:hypothetical protein
MSPNNELIILLLPDGRKDISIKLNDKTTLVTMFNIVSTEYNLLKLRESSMANVIAISIMLIDGLILKIKANAMPSNEEWDKLSPRYDNLCHIINDPKAPVTRLIMTSAIRLLMKKSWVNISSMLYGY